MSIRYDPNSGDAWARFRKRNGDLTVNGLIVQAITVEGPVSCDRICVRIGGKHQTVSAQIRHLRDDGELVVAGQKRQGGRIVNLYGLCPREPQLRLI